MLFVTQLLDADDPVLGFTVDLIDALARRCTVVVIANEVRRVPSGFRAELISLGKEWGAGRIRRTLAYQTALLREVRGGRPDALLAHMCPIYLTVAAPLLRAVGVRLGLWFAHPSVHMNLRLAEMLSDVVLTSLPGAYPRTSRKVLEIGQAIDTDFFEPTTIPPRSGATRLVAVGRTSPSKGFATIIRGVHLTSSRGANVRLSIVGSATTSNEERHREELRRLIDELGAGPYVELLEGVTRQNVRKVLNDAHVLVNGMIAGSADKVVFEAMATGRPVIASNPVFAPLLEGLPVNLRFRQSDAEGLADVLTGIEAAAEDEWAEIGRTLRNRVEHAHSLEHWADSVLDALCSRR